MGVDRQTRNVVRGDGKPASPEWGDGLAYPAPVGHALPAVHRGFNVLNKWFSVPLLRMGLGRFMSTPVTGYLMILRTRGRTSGLWRDAPLGYTIIGDAVYCIAGFGRKTHWYRNVLADPKVEVILPSRSFSGIADEVTDPEERRRVLPPLARSMGVVAMAFGMGNPWRDAAEEIERKYAGLPLIRIRATGIAAGPEDPGGWFWAVAQGLMMLLAWLWWRGRRSRSRPSKFGRDL